MSEKQETAWERSQRIQGGMRKIMPPPPRVVPPSASDLIKMPTVEGYQLQDNRWSNIPMDLGRGMIRAGVRDLPAAARFSASWWADEFSRRQPDSAGPNWLYEDRGRQYEAAALAASEQSEKAEKLLRESGLDPEAGTFSEKVGGFLLPVAGVEAGTARGLGALTRLARLPIGVRPSPTGIIERSAAQSRRSIPRLLTEDLTAAAGGAGGAELAEGTPFEIPAALGGSFVGLGGLAGGRYLGKQALSRVPFAQTAVARTGEAFPASSRFLPRISDEQMAVDELEAVVGDAARASESFALREALPEADPSLAGIVNARGYEPGIANLERSLLEGNPELLGVHAARRTQGVGDLSASLDRGATPGSPEALAAGLRASFDADAAAATAGYEAQVAGQRGPTMRARADYDAELAAARASEAQATAAAATTRSAMPGDADVRSTNVAGAPANRRAETDATGLFAAEDAVFAPIRREYQALDATAEQLGIQVGGRPVVLAYHDLAREFGGDEYLRLPPDVRKQVAEIKEAPKNEWKKIRALQASVNRSLRFATEEVERHQLRALRKAVDEVLFDPQVEAAIPGLAQTNAKFRQAAATFREGEMRSVLHPNPQRRVPGESAVKRLVRPDRAEGSIADADRVVAALGSGPTTLRVEFENAIVALAMRDHAGNIPRYMESHKTVLNRFPTARARLQQVVDADAAREAQSATVKNLPPFRPAKQPKIPPPQPEKSVRSRYLDSPRKTIKALVESPDGVAGLTDLSRQATRITGGAQGLQTQGIRFFRDKLSARPTASQIRETMNRHGASLEILVGPDQIRRWTQVADELERLEAMELPTITRVPGSPVGEAEEGLIRIATNELLSPAKRTVRAAQVGASLRQSFMNDRVRQMLETAITRPNEEGLRLLRQVRPESQRPIKRAIVSPVGTAIGVKGEQQRDRDEKRREGKR